MKVIVYVEGPSDKAALSALLSPLLELKRQEGVAIEFFETPAGDRKASLLTKVPKKAVNIILNDPHAIVVAMPDLYPKNKVFPHENFDELARGLIGSFGDAFRAKRPEYLATQAERFKVFCLKHDLEALLLACKSGLTSRLGASPLDTMWKTPVEDQNHDRPPRRIVEELFARHHKRYRDTVDAPLILSMCSYRDIADLCPQCFKPFVEFLAGLA
ncbi:MAG: DUF4276 family protein [Acidobacteria bacterium]|nr:DUF4276 family protein [Acidobacteriota bacterium]